MVSKDWSGGRSTGRPAFDFERKNYRLERAKSTQQPQGPANQSGDDSFSHYNANDSITDIKPNMHRQFHA